MSRPFPILLVEDGEADVELTLRAFRQRNVVNPIVVVRDGAEALDYIHRRAAFTGDAPLPGVVLLDLRLPKVDGIEVLRAIKGDERYRSIPVVVLTTSAEERDVSAAYALGAASYIVKPVEFEKFLQVVERINLYWILTNLPHPRVHAG